MKKERHKIVPAAYVIIRNQDNKILFHRRQNTGYMDGCFSLPAGHIEEFETPSQCAVREAREEVDVLIEPSDLRFGIVVFRPGNDRDHERVDVFLDASRWSGVPKIMEPEKNSELAWFSIDDLPKQIEPVTEAALRALSRGERYLEFNY